MLAISTCQWIGGHICFEVSYFIEIEHRMDEAEKALAEAVKEETGVETDVAIIGEEQLIPRGNIYSGFFAFSENQGEETVYFTLSNESSSIRYEQVTQPQQSQNQQDEKAAQLSSLHQDFTIPVNEFPVAKTTVKQLGIFQFAEFSSQIFISLLTPPPDLA